MRITQSKSGYATAEAEEILRTAPERILPACPHFGACGGCHYQHTDYKSQLAFKQAILRETLERGGVTVPAEIDLLSGEPWRYRNRIRLAFDAAGKLGYRGRRSHAVVSMRECPIVAPLLVEAAQAFAQVARGFAPLLRPTEIALFCNAEETSAAGHCLHCEPGQECALMSWLRRCTSGFPRSSELNLVTEGRPGQQPRTLAQWGAASLNYRCRRFRLSRGPRRIFSGQSLAGGCARRAGRRRPSRQAGLGLFAGVGLFARQLAVRFDRVVAVESAPSATAALEENLRGTAGMAVQAETLAFLRRSRGGEHPDLIVVDPPRTGLGAESCALLAEIAAPAVAYVSCDPATLARDLRTLIASGYQIQSITLADLFPQTFHLETVVQLRRS